MNDKPTKKTDPEDGWANDNRAQETTDSLSVTSRSFLKNSMIDHPPWVEEDKSSLVTDDAGDEGRCLSKEYESLNVIDEASGNELIEPLKSSAADEKPPKLDMMTEEVESASNLADCATGSKIGKDKVLKSGEGYSSIL